MHVRLKDPLVGFFQTGIIVFLSAAMVIYKMAGHDRQYGPMRTGFRQNG